MEKTLTKLEYQSYCDAVNDDSFDAFREKTLRLYLLNQLRAFGWNVEGTAKKIGLSRSKIRRLLAQLEIEREHTINA